jgi:hypothetical protein
MRIVRLQHVPRRIRNRVYVQHVVTLSVEVVRQMGWGEGTVDLELFSIGKGRVVLQVASPLRNSTPEEKVERAKHLALSLFGGASDGRV